MQKSYHFGNINISFLSDCQFDDDEQMLPFLCNADAADIKCTFRQTDSIILNAEERIYTSRTVKIYRNSNETFKTYSLPLLTEESAKIFKDDSGYICEYKKEKSEYFSHSVNMLNAIGIEQLAFERGMFILHCSFIEYNGEAILFSGPSGVGKSTRADMWRSKTDADIINGDKAGLFLENGRIYACGLPVAGSSKIYKNKVLPVKAIFILKQAEKNRTRAADFFESVKAVYYNTVVNKWNADFCEKAMTFSSDIFKYTDVFVSECNLDFNSVEEQLNAMGDLP